MIFSKHLGFGSGILSFGLRPEKTGPEGGAGRGANQNFGTSTFYITGIPAKIGRRSLLVLCNSLIRRPPRAPRVPRGPGGGKIKSLNWGIFYSTPPQNQMLRTFCFIQLFDSTQPRGSTGPSKSSKRGPNSWFAK